MSDRNIPDEQYLADISEDIREQIAERASAPIVSRWGSYADVALSALLNEVERLKAREKYLLESHTGCGCEPSCKVCEERGFT